ncbi:MAG: hypothetical protein AAGF72_18575, partial [Pseudomonadota bacterium]
VGANWSCNRPAAMSSDAPTIIYRLTLDPVLVWVDTKFVSDLVRRTVKIDDAKRDIRVFI